jgi:hypothetical protein
MISNDEDYHDFLLPNCHLCTMYKHISSRWLGVERVVVDELNVSGKGPVFEGRHIL